MGGMSVNADVNNFAALFQFFETNMQQFVATRGLPVYRLLWLGP